MREQMYTHRGMVGAFVMLAILSAQSAIAAPVAKRSFDRLIDAVVREGPGGQLPPHLSVVLGISALEQETAVKQAVVRDGHDVHVFNVCTANHHDLVILTHNDQNQSTKAYVMSTTGQLRKAVFFQGSEPAEQRLMSEARDDFAAEIKFWMDFSSQLPHSK